MRKVALGVYSFVVASVVTASILAPPPFTVEAAVGPETPQDKSQIQSLTVSSSAAAPKIERDSYTVEYTPPPPPEPEPAPAPSAAPKYSGGGSPSEWMAAAGIAESDWGYVDYVVSKESSWNPNATNDSSGACGLVQALPCSKVPGAGGYDPVANLTWANGYAVGRYGSWAGAYDFWINNHWW